MRLVQSVPNFLVGQLSGPVHGNPDISLVKDAIQEFIVEMTAMRKQSSKEHAIVGQEKSVIAQPSKVQLDKESDLRIQQGDSELRPRDYKARDVFHDILRDLVPSIKNLYIDTEPKGYNGLVLLNTPGKRKRNRLARIEGEDELSNLTINVYFWEGAVKRVKAKAKKLHSWEAVYQCRDMIRESVLNILRG